mmetsp:Transcript_11923/g.16919  ORF Transcript_11923/g.16919 Transcript_11923/m.16919 type:complete len:285 (+) Transcript_11923:1330-2184(+)
MYSSLLSTSSNYLPSQNAITSIGWIFGACNFARKTKIRESDGLLQRYLEKVYHNSTTYQGAMSSYWYGDNNNQRFIQLWHLSKRYKDLKEIMKELSEEIDEEDQVEEGDQILLDQAQSFLYSFRNRAQRVWGRLSAPYRKATKEELNDFIADDDDAREEEESGLPHPMFNPGSVNTPEDNMIEHLRGKRMAAGHYSDESDEDIDEEEDIEEELLVESKSDHDIVTDSNNGRKNDYNANISSGEEEYYSEKDEQSDDDVQVNEQERENKLLSARKKRIIESDDDD